MLDMAIRSEPQALKSGHTQKALIAIRSFTIVLGATGVLWGVELVPIFHKDFAIERIATQITAGQSYKSEALARQLPAIQAIEQSSICRPAALRSAAIIRLTLVENLNSSSEKSQLDENMNALRDSVRISLSCSPSDALLWLIYYWVQTAQSSDASNKIKYLRMSYQLGPNEAWIGVVRNRFAFAIFEQLPPDLAEDAVNEFIGMLDTGRLYRQVAEIFLGPAWRARKILLPRLASVPERELDAFRYELGRLGYDMELPGFDKRDRRPWR